MFIRSRLLIVFVLSLFSLNCYSMNWGHLLTGTPETLKKGEGTAGTLLIGAGLTDKTTVGTSPFAYIIYNFFNVIVREQLHKGERFSNGLDLMYFDSIHDQHSDYQQMSWTARLNNRIKINDSFAVNSSFGLQYFINEKSPYSFRPDPLGRYRTNKITDEPFYEQKLADYEMYHRDPKTISLSLMPEIFLMKDLFLNVEYGFMGVNYTYPLQHFGASINYQFSTCDIGFGASRSRRVTPVLGTEIIDHAEAKLQFYFE